MIPNARNKNQHGAGNMQRCLEAFYVDTAIFLPHALFEN